MSDHYIGFAILLSLAVVALYLTIDRDEVDTKAPQQATKGAVRVIDGDTLQIGETRVRLFGIDAPELGQVCIAVEVEQDCGAQSKNYLKQLILGREINCELISKDRWGRDISRCAVGDLDIGYQMVEQGWAIAYREYADEYVPAENLARSTKRGIWATRFQEPSEWRRTKRGG